jgi:hypothetical protein
MPEIKLIKNKNKRNLYIAVIGGEPTRPFDIYDMLFSSGFEFQFVNGNSLPFKDCERGDFILHKVDGGY